MFVISLCLACFICSGIAFFRYVCISFVIRLFILVRPLVSHWFLYFVISSVSSFVRDFVRSLFVSVVLSYVMSAFVVSLGSSFVISVFSGLFHYLVRSVRSGISYFVRYVFSSFDSSWFISLCRDFGRS